MPYLNVAEVETALLLASAAPFSAYTQLLPLPYLTWEGRQCNALKIGNGSSSGRPAVCFLGGVHAREWGSCDILVNFIQQLQQSYRTGTAPMFGASPFSASDVKTIVDTLDVIVFPQVNPDGRAYSMTADAMWRKNRRTSAPNSPACPGVDVNRNFDFLWDFTTGFDPLAATHTSNDPCDLEVFHGPSAFSEPESRNVQWLLDSFPSILAFIDVHSYGEDILYSWGDDESQSADPNMTFLNAAYDGQRGIGGDAYKEYVRPDDRSRSLALATAVGAAIHAVRGIAYTVKPSYDLYPTSGASDDYVYSRGFADPTKAKTLAFTVEWGTEFQPPYAEMQNIVTELTSGLLGFCLKACEMENAVAWQLTGNSVTDPATDFLGTTDNQPLGIRTNSVERLRVTTDGNTGLGTSAPSARLSVVASGASEVGGTARSATLLTSAGSLAGAAGSELALASLGFVAGGNSASLGVRALRVSNGADWPTTAIGLGMDVDNTKRAGASVWLHANGGVGLGTSAPSARLSVVASGASEVGGTARSATLLTSAGSLAGAAGSELALASLGFVAGGNSASLGVRALRVSNGADWPTTAIGLGMDVDNTKRAGASLWLHANGGVGLGTSAPSARLSVVASGASEVGGTARSATLLTSAGSLAGAAGSELALASLGFVAGGNSASLGVRALRVSNGADWPTTAIGLGMDVDNTKRAGASVWLHANGTVGIGTTQPSDNALHVSSNSTDSWALRVESTGGSGAVAGEANGNQYPAIVGWAHGGAAGVHGFATKTTIDSFGVIGTVGGPNPYLVSAVLPGGIGVVGHSGTGVGVAGVTEGQGGGPTNGVEGSHDAVTGVGAGLHGLTGSASGVAVYGANSAAGGQAGRFIGDVGVQGTLATSGKAFRIDHPLEPAEKYLTHASVESPEMLNVYNGTVTTDQTGQATVTLPAYFAALNRDYTYQLTVIGEFTGAAVAREIDGENFVIRTERPGVRVSWQVTGIRQDRYAEAHRIVVEEAKGDGEKGRYLHPELYEKGPGEAHAGEPIGWLPNTRVQRSDGAPA
jgi:carboxypeptidase T